MSDRPKRAVRAFSELLGSARLQVSASVRAHLKNHRLWSRWQEIVGPDLSRVTSPLELKGRVLFISVAHQAWAQQLFLLKPSLLNKIKTLCPESDVQDLQFRAGKVIQMPEQEKIEKSIPTKKVQLSERQEMTLRAVEDVDLRAQIRLAMEAEAGRQKFPNS